MIHVFGGIFHNIMYEHYFYTHLKTSLDGRHQIKHYEESVTFEIGYCPYKLFNLVEFQYILITVETEQKCGNVSNVGPVFTIFVLTSFTIFVLTSFLIQIKESYHQVKCFFYYNINMVTDFALPVGIHHSNFALFKNKSMPQNFEQIVTSSR